MRFGTARADVARLSLDYAALRLVSPPDATDDGETVELPLTPRALDVATLVIVSIHKDFVRVGSTVARTDDQLRAATEALARSPDPVALFRVASDVPLEDLLRVARTTRAAGFEVRVLGSVEPGEPPSADGAWHMCDCPFPNGAAYDDIDEVTVAVLVDDDGHGLPGIVHVNASPNVGFRWPAAVCASFQRFAPTDAPHGRPRFGVPLGIHFTR